MVLFEEETGETVSCTCCFHPSIVNLSDDSNESKCVPSPELQKNLQRYGWSLIRYTAGKRPTRTWKDERVVPLFRCQESFRSSQFSFQFRTNESGGNQQELKQSWEISLRSHKTSNETNVSLLQQQVERNMVDWFQLFHKIAVAVCRHLQMPYNSLLEEDKPMQRLDVLRAFYYETVGQSIQNQDDGVDPLGSNPHTDWGSFTIVWQDEVGGLQTYCRRCRVWTDVNPVPNTFVVHCSDITSLVLQSKWPSPLHRVVSPKCERRASLVYFGYPPRHLSLKNISESLSTFRRLNLQTAASEEDYSTLMNSDHANHLLGDYSLLKNQAVEAAAPGAAKQQFARIYDIPLHQVIQDKWQQVQR